MESMNINWPLVLCVVFLIVITAPFWLLFVLAWWRWLKETLSYF